ncbi:YhcH/YjgK/YiaL family protein [uncultured Pseudodesulfovibrio sp.]|uniref:YhcH/YjgK/YiaL family protein n=1 Tax=uncultured Pseudodesulfovibrio sp. TaxID=2035858 RepID=UPI0029C75DA9|nr:YhcH/YjgK/YiaL family protein [uncultured Pseudodesulfovibrio sp.]
MIIDTLENADKYICLNPRFATAFAVLRRSNLACFNEGRLEIDGDDVYAIIAKGPGRKRADAQLETHDKYIDIQYVINGTDTIGWKSRQELGDPTDNSDPQNDVAFYDDEPSAWSAVGPGMFGIYFPEDGHMPMISDNELHKAIIKVAV